MAQERNAYILQALSVRSCATMYASVDSWVNWTQFRTIFRANGNIPIEFDNGLPEKSTQRILTQCLKIRIVPNACDVAVLTRPLT